jgi:hypothetical protein
VDISFKGLFMGIDRYASAGINWLSCASRDAKASHALFTDALGGDTTLLQASAASRRTHKLEATANSLRKRRMTARKEIVLVVMATRWFCS